MSDGVRFIFKTLFKVPIIILIAYLIFNVFAFGVTYFKMLGISYVVMETAVENNYIPQNEKETLNNYLQSMVSQQGVVDSASLIGADTGKKQYGEAVTIGVQAHYRFIWPLMPTDQLTDTSANITSGFADDGTLQNRREDASKNVKNNITITYTVPGLQYYPDLN